MNTKQTILILTLAVFAAMPYNKGLAQIAEPLPAEPLSKIHFSYDQAGNRIIRERIFLNKKLKTSGDTDTAYADIPNEEMLTNKELAEDEENSSFEAALGGIQVSIFPNPVESKLSVRIEHLDKTSISMLSLLNISGKLLYKKETLLQTEDLDFSNYAKGAYILRIAINGTQKEWTVIKQ